MGFLALLTLAVQVPPARRIRMPMETALAQPRSPSSLWPMLRRVCAAEAEDELAAMLPGAPRAAEGLPCGWDDFERLHALIETAGFRPFDARDQQLSSALNAGYLLRLSIEPALAMANASFAASFPQSDGGEPLYEGRVLMYHRGYTTERSRGRLLLPKIDYLQAAVVQRAVAKVFGALGGLKGRLGQGRHREGSAVEEPAAAIRFDTDLPEERTREVGGRRPWHLPGRRRRVRAERERERRRREERGREMRVREKRRREKRMSAIARERYGATVDDEQAAIPVDAADPQQIPSRSQHSPTYPNTPQHIPTHPNTSHLPHPHPRSRTRITSRTSSRTPWRPSGALASSSGRCRL